jgi:hypothetical protein
MSILNNVPKSIPFLDLVTPHVELERELTCVFSRALHTAGFIGGPMVEEFEAAFVTRVIPLRLVVVRTLCGSRLWLAAYNAATL